MKSRYFDVDVYRYLQGKEYLRIASLKPCMHAWVELTHSERVVGNTRNTVDSCCCCAQPQLDRSTVCADQRDSVENTTRGKKRSTIAFQHRKRRFSGLRRFLPKLLEEPSRSASNSSSRPCSDHLSNNNQLEVLPKVFDKRR